MLDRPVAGVCVMLLRSLNYCTLPLQFHINANSTEAGKTFISR